MRKIVRYVQQQEEMQNKVKFVPAKIGKSSHFQLPETITGETRETEHVQRYNTFYKDTDWGNPTNHLLESERSQRN